MEIKDIKAVYFVGAGGIGMSAIARYFIHRGIVVAGYDKTPSNLTKQLEKEGMIIHYTEDVTEIPHACKDPKTCLVIYTPAIPAEHKELVFFREGGFEIQKRAQVLGTLTRTHKGLCVAGTHGKTTTSTMCAHIMHQSSVDCNAFLGGISKNYGTNYILSDNSDYVVIEADEFDRSFHWLRPWMSVITATDPDHLDIYGTKEAYLESFRHYTELIQPGGALIIHTGLEMKPNVQEGVKIYEYSLDKGDFHAENIRIGNGEIFIEGLRVGDYTVSEVSDGASANYVLPADKKVTILADKTTVAQMHNELRDTPKTGDDSKPWLWAALMGVSAMGAAALGVAAYVGKRKKGKNTAKYRYGTNCKRYSSFKNSFHHVRIFPRN